MIGSSGFWQALAISNFRVVAGFTLAAFVAIPLGVFLGSFPRAAGAMAPIMDFGRYLPVPALVPLSIIWAGVGDLQKILVLFIGCFFHLLVMVTDSIRRVPQLHVDSADLGSQSSPGRIQSPSSRVDAADLRRVPRRRRPDLELSDGRRTGGVRGWTRGHHHSR